MTDNVSGNPTLQSPARLTRLRNRGDLAEGWYDPATLIKANQGSSKDGASGTFQAAKQRVQSSDFRDTDDDEYGPCLPGGAVGDKGPTQPEVQDLIIRKGIADCHDETTS